MPLFSIRYSDPAPHDTLTAVKEKVDIVTTNMKENIQQVLQNQEKIEKIEAAAIQLNETSQAFKSNSKNLAQKMLWKKWKMRLLIGGLIIAVLIIIIVPFAVQANQANQSTKH